MEKLKITLKDGSIREVEKGISVYDVVKGIHSGLAKEAIAAEVDNTLTGLYDTLTKDVSLNVLKFDSEKAQDVFRHTSSHILAQAVKRLYPDAKLGIGPAIENGFYYDFDLEHRFTEEELTKIEKKWRKSSQKN